VTDFTTSLIRTVHCTVYRSGAAVHCTLYSVQVMLLAYSLGAGAGRCAWRRPGFAGFAPSPAVSACGSNPYRGSGCRGSAQAPTPGLRPPPAGSARLAAGTIPIQRPWRSGWRRNTSVWPAATLGARRAASHHHPAFLAYTVFPNAFAFCGTVINPAWRARAGLRPEIRARSVLTSLRSACGLWFHPCAPGRTDYFSPTAKALGNTAANKRKGRFY